MQTYSHGCTPEDVIKKAAMTQCPSGYHMTIKSQREWAVIAAAVNEGIDSDLEAITERSTFDSRTGKCLVHPEELHILLRRLYESGNEEAWDLRGCILTTLDIEEV